MILLGAGYFSKLNEARKVSPETVPAVKVSTVSAIIVHPEDPYRVLIAESSKHEKPIIPGGKIESKDLSSDPPESALVTLRREVKEEIGTEIIAPRLVGTATDPNRDIRMVSRESLEDVMTDPPLGELEIGEDELVKAHYGSPDYIFLGTVDPDEIATTKELSKVGFIDLREISLGDLSAGHDLVLLYYRYMLEQGEESFFNTALKDIEADKLFLTAC